MSPSEINKEMALIAVQKNGYNLKYIPQELMDKEITITAVKNDGCAINYISEELIEEITKELQEEQNSDNNNELEQKDTKQKKIVRKI